MEPDPSDDTSQTEDGMDDHKHDKGNLIKADQEC